MQVRKYASHECKPSLYPHVIPDCLYALEASDVPRKLLQRCVAMLGGGPMSSSPLNFPQNECACFKKW
jgi:hypothetical protein